MKSCKWCDTEFPTRYAYGEHIRTDQKCASFKNIKAECQVCKIVIEGKREFLNHVCKEADIIEFMKKNSKGDVVQPIKVLPVRKLGSSIEERTQRAIYQSIALIEKDGFDEMTINECRKLVPPGLTRRCEVMDAMHRAKAHKFFENDAVVEIYKVLTGIFDIRAINGRGPIDITRLISYKSTIPQKVDGITLIHVAYPLSVFSSMYLNKMFGVKVFSSKLSKFYTISENRRHYDDQNGCEPLELMRIHYNTLAVKLFRAFYQSITGHNNFTEKWDSIAEEWDDFMTHLYKNIIISSSSALWYYCCVKNIKSVGNDFMKTYSKGEKYIAQNIVTVSTYERFDLIVTSIGSKEYDDVVETNYFSTVFDNGFSSSPSIVQHEIEVLESCISSVFGERLGDIHKLDAWK